MKLDPKKLEFYRDLLKQKVCSVCIDSDADGKCTISRTPDRACPIDMFLPEIVQAIESVQSNRMEDYVESFRTHVCSQCQEDETGRCRFRSDIDCAMDRYIQLIVEAIEEAPDREEAKPAP